MHSTITYHVLNVFNSRPFSGNPAAVVLLEGREKERVDSEELYLNIAAQINAPATAFISRRNDSTDYDIRWFNSGYELGLCAHATLAAARCLLSNSSHLHSKRKSSSSSLPASGPTAVQRFRSQSGALLQTKELPNGTLELECPQIFVAPLSKTCREEEIRDITRLVAAALCNKHSIVIVDINRGTGGFEDWLQVEVALAPRTRLKDLPINFEAIVSTSSSSFHFYQSHNCVETTGSLWHQEIPHHNARNALTHPNIHFTRRIPLPQSFLRPASRL
jgi:predicted PhzF superfamily epimerase YddE/YHI9